MAELSNLNPFKRADIQLAGTMLRTFQRNERFLEAILLWLFQTWQQNANDGNIRTAMTAARELRHFLSLTMSMADIPMAIVEHRHEHSVVPDDFEARKSALVAAIREFVASGPTDGLAGPNGNGKGNGTNGSGPAS